MHMRCDFPVRFYFFLVFEIKKKLFFGKAVPSPYLELRRFDEQLRGTPRRGRVDGIQAYA